jgi:perosamine synthetase
MKMIPVFKPYTTGKEIEYLKEVLDSGWWGPGPKTREFEEKCAGYIGTKYALGLNSATAALHLAFKCLDIRDKEVITPSMTFVSSNHAILYCGGIPVFCDIEPDTLNIDAGKIEALITANTKAIQVVHYGGRACDMDKIMEIAQKHDLFVVEDCAHAFGGGYKGRKPGSIGDFGCFSFHAVKNLAAGDGGMIVTNKEDCYERMKKLRWMGITKDTFNRNIGRYSWFYDVVEPGFKYHMNDITAAIGLAQFENIYWLNEQRKKWSDYYSKNLQGVGDIELPPIKDYMAPSYHNYVIKTSHRDELQEYLKENGISTGVHYYPNHLFDMYKPYYRNLPVTESVWKKVLTLPLFPALSQKEVDLIIKTIKSFYEKAKNW